MYRGEIISTCESSSVVGYIRDLLGRKWVFMHYENKPWNKKGVIVNFKNGCCECDGYVATFVTKANKTDANNYKKVKKYINK